MLQETCIYCSSEFELQSLDHHNISELELINLRTLPVIYKKAFYDSLLSDSTKHGYILKYRGITAGGCAYWIEKNQCYIMTLGIVPEMRMMKLGSWMLEQVENFVKEMGLNKICLHVQTNNLAAKQFYEKNKYKIVATDINYYKNVIPRSAYVFEKRFKM
ncbi:putative N-acetyltransferase san [Astathelohania contejeani]|uniref:N-acetyltransferase san n=1 Tax=Astathelohania contejeani TaxID=164912 RepID=A0ABQ7I2E6_9MICR|nr:putative N-acetyltransferase san [Thelohania contejeani]